MKPNVQNWVFLKKIIIFSLQVCDTLPEELFTEYDVPIDMIVTPTAVFRVEKRLKRPAGIYWSHLSERRLGIVPILQTLKENEEK